MNYIQIYISLKIPDNVARTALYSVKTRMGCPALVDLKRSDFWEFHFPNLESASAQALVERLVTKTSYFMNPNKHRWALRVSPTSMQEQIKAPSPFPAQASLLVEDSIDGSAESTFEAILKLLPENEQPASLKRGVWWDLSFEGMPSSQVQETVERLAITRSRTQGLFANPHYQSCKIFFS